MNNDNNTINPGTPEYNQYLMGIAGGLTRYGSAPVKNVDIAQFKTDLEKRYMMITEVECTDSGNYTLKKVL